MPSASLCSIFCLPHQSCLHNPYPMPLHITCPPHQYDPLPQIGLSPSCWYSLINPSPMTLPNRPSVKCPLSSRTSLVPLHIHSPTLHHHLLKHIYQIESATLCQWYCPQPYQHIFFLYIFPKHNSSPRLDRLRYNFIFLTFEPHIHSLSKLKVPKSKPFPPEPFPPVSPF